MRSRITIIILESRESSSSSITGIFGNVYVSKGIQTDGMICNGRWRCLERNEYLDPRRVWLET